MPFRLQLILGVAAIEAAALLILIFSGLSLLQSSNEEEVVKRATTITKLFATTIKDAVLATDLASLQSSVDELLTNPGIVYARVKGQNDVVFAEGGDKEFLARPFVPDEHYRDANDNTFDTYADIVVAGVRYGRIEVGFSVAMIKEVLATARQKAIIIAISGMLLVAIFSFFLGLYLTRGLKALEEASRHISTGALGYQVKVSGKGELAQAVQAFNEMSRKLEVFYNERKQAEQDLQQSEARIRAVVDNVLDGIVTINELGVVESFNRAAERIFEYSSHEVIGRNFTVLFPPQDRREFEDYMKSYTSADKERPGFGLEITGRRKNGSTFPMELGLSEMRFGGGHVFVCIVRDITDRKKIDRMKNEFISTVSHELRTPLTSMLGSLSLLSEGVGGELSAQGEALVKMARNNTSRLVHLINNILDIDNIQSGKMRLNLKPVELMPLVNQAVEENRTLAQQSGIKFLFSAVLPGAKVYADHKRLIQVVDNLLSNAAKFSPPGGAVEIAVVRRGMAIRVSVTDHGPGIPKKFHDHVFEKFAHIDSSDTRQQSGAGLGLSIARAIVERHGGHMDFEAQLEGGTRFYFELPEWHDDQVRAQA